MELFCCSISLNPYMVFQTWNQRKKKKKESNSIAYIADVSCLTNHSIYMQTLSLMDYLCRFYFLFSFIC